MGGGGCKVESTHTTRPNQTHGVILAHRISEVEDSYPRGLHALMLGELTILRLPSKVVVIAGGSLDDGILVVLTDVTSDSIALVLTYQVLGIKHREATLNKLVTVGVHRTAEGKDVVHRPASVIVGVRGADVLIDTTLVVLALRPVTHNLPIEDREVDAIGQRCSQELS